MSNHAWENLRIWAKPSIVVARPAGSHGKLLHYGSRGYGGTYGFDMLCTLSGENSVPAP